MMGKSFLAQAIRYEALKQGHHVRYHSIFHPPHHQDR